MIVCERCGRYGRYDVKRLIAAHGADAKLPDLLATLANCPKARSAFADNAPRALRLGKACQMFRPEVFNLEQGPSKRWAAAGPRIW